jgi:predicted DNA-binding transcriptional regulator YafY
MDAHSGGQVGGGQFATRINTALDLLTVGTPTAQAIEQWARQFGVSTRQARRYIDHARVTGPMVIPEPAVVFTVRLPTSLTAEHETNTTISALVTEALTSYLPADHQDPRP